jgi:hypothetical protein
MHKNSRLTAFLRDTARPQWFVESNFASIRVEAFKGR